MILILYDSTYQITKLLPLSISKPLLHNSHPFDHSFKNS